MLDKDGVLVTWAQWIGGALTLLLVAVAPLSKYLRAWIGDRAADAKAEAERALYQELRLHLEALSKEVHELRTQNKELRLDNARLEARLHVLEEREVRIHALQAELSERELRIEQLLQDKSALQREVSDLRDRVARLEAEIRRLEA